MKTSLKGVAAGTIINGCKIVSQIGSGGMGSVYKAHDEALDRMVAIKIMHSEAAGDIGKARFIREASAIARLDHPGITRIYSYGEFEGLPFFIMEFVEGRSIKDFINHCRAIHLSGHNVEDLIASGYIKQSGPDIPFFLKDQVQNPLRDQNYSKKIKRLMMSAASALANAHREGIIHRDIKSSNMLIVDDERIKLIDFGLVKSRGDKDITKADHFMGTLAYAAPEQLMGSRGKISARTDIYGFGIVLYELATLRHPVSEEDPAAIIAQITSGEFTRPSQLNPLISANLEAIILKCLNKKPEKRFGNAEELFNSLRGENLSSTWFSGFTEMLKGWFLKESVSVESEPENKESPQPIQSQDNNQQTQITATDVARKYLKTARKKFFKNFAVLEAIDSLKQAFEIEPGNAETLFLLGFSLNAIGQSSELKTYLDTAEANLLDASEKDSGKLNLIRTIFIDRNYDEGKRMSMRLQQIFPDDFDFSLALFFCYEALGNYPEAIKVGEVLLKSLPENNIIAVAKCECYFSIMDFPRAIEILRERVIQFPDYHNLRLKIIQALLISGKFSEALAEVKISLKKDPQNLLLQFYYARILVISKNYSEAYNAFRQAVSIPGDDGLRAMGFYYLYRLMELQNRPEQADKYLRQAKELRKKMEFPANGEVRQIIDNQILNGLADEIGDRAWTSTALDYARKVCFDSVDLHAFTIGNYGCTSVIEIKADRSFAHHCIFSNFSLHDNQELYTQLWLPEAPASPLIDESGNILTSHFFKIDGKIPGGIASISFSKPWKSCQASHIYCRLSDKKLEKDNDDLILSWPELPMPACRKQAFIAVVPSELHIESCSEEPEQSVVLESSKALCFFPYLAAGEIFNVEIRLKPPLSRAFSARLKSGQK